MRQIKSCARMSKDTKPRRNIYLEYAKMGVGHVARRCTAHVMNAAENAGRN